MLNLHFLGYLRGFQTHNSRARDVVQAAAARITPYPKDRKASLGEVDAELAGVGDLGAAAAIFWLLPRATRAANDGLDGKCSTVVRRRGHQQQRLHHRGMEAAAAPGQPKTAKTTATNFSGDSDDAGAREGRRARKTATTAPGHACCLISQSERGMGRKRTKPTKTKHHFLILQAFAHMQQSRCASPTRHILKQFDNNKSTKK